MHLFCTCISLQLLAHVHVPHKEEDNLLLPHLLLLSFFLIYNVK